MPRDDTNSDVRVHAELAIERAAIVELIGEEPRALARVDGGLTNTLHRATMRGGASYAIKHYVDRTAFDDELATLRRLAGVIPVPEVIRADDARRAIVYRWVDGTTMDDCRRSYPPAAFASLAEPIGRLLGRMSILEPEEVAREAVGMWDVVPLVEHTRERLAAPSRVREQLGGATCDALRAEYERAGENLGWGPHCIAHGDFGSRNLIVRDAGGRWEVAGVIDWESIAGGVPFVDLGALFRYGDRYDGAFREAFARGYAETGVADLPDRWFLHARLLDATWIVDTLDDETGDAGVFAECRGLVHRLLAELRSAT